MKIRIPLSANTPRPILYRILVLETDDCMPRPKKAKFELKELHNSA
jgi:hypothetical protein